MSQTGPWSVKGIDQRARDAAREAAHAEGITLGEYLNRLLMSVDAPRPNEVAYPFQNRRPTANAANDTLDTLTRRIEATEARSTLAITGMDHTILGLVARLEEAEQNSAAVAGHVDSLIEELKDTHSALQEKVQKLEADDTTRENLEALKQPERRMIDVLRMSAEDFLSEVTVTDQEVATVYEASKSERYSEPDTRTYVELMFSSREAARTAFGLLAAGADPASVEGVASRETRTGRRESVSDPLLAEAMFGAGKQSGALFGPAERGDQWLVARLVSVQPGAVFPLEQVEGEIRDQLSRERAAVLLFEKMEALDRAIGAGYPISQIAEEVGVPLITFAPVDQSGRTRESVALMGLITAGEAFQQAFEIPVGETSNRIDIGEATYLTSPHKVLESYTPEFEELREDVRTGLVRQREANGVQAALDDLTDRIKSGESTLEAEARAANEVVETPLAPITRRTAADSGLPNAAVTSVFSGKEGDVFTFPSRTGDAVMVMQITDITPPSEADMSELAPLANSSLLTSLQTDLDQAMEAEIAATMKLRTNQGTLRAYKATITSDQ